MYNKILIILAFVICASCTGNKVFDQYQVAQAKGWHKDSIKQFEITNLDSLQTYNLFINLRNDNDYLYQNIFLISSIKFPNGKTLTDTLEYRMANPDGDWLGTGFSDIKENKLWFREGVRFTEEGTYVVAIEQAVRANGVVEGEEWLKGILDVGLSIENEVKK